MTRDTVNVLSIPWVGNTARWVFPRYIVHVLTVYLQCPGSGNWYLSPVSTGRQNREHPPDICGKDETGCTHSRGNRKHAHCEDLDNSPSIQRRHETSSPPLPLPPSSPSPTSSHSSSEVSASEPSTSFAEPPSCLTGDNVGEMTALSSSQKETKESLEEQDLRGGGLSCPNETSEWRSLNKAGIGDCLKSPKMGHWQHAEGVEL